MPLASLLFASSSAIASIVPGPTGGSIDPEVVDAVDRIVNEASFDEVERILVETFGQDGSQVPGDSGSGLTDGGARRWRAPVLTIDLSMALPGRAGSAGTGKWKLMILIAWPFG